MSSWYELRVGAIRVIYGGSILDFGLLIPFQRADLRIQDFDEDEGEFLFAAPARVVGRRLDLLGFTAPRSGRRLCAGVRERTGGLRAVRLVAHNGRMAKHRRV
jgi:hypothetical protein